MVWSLAQHIYGFEGTPAAKLFMVGFLGAALLSLALARMPASMWMLTGMLMITTLTAATTYDRTEYLPQWLLPVQMRRPEIQLGIGLLLLLGLLSMGRLNLAKMSPHAWFLLAIAMLAGSLQTVHTTAQDAIKTIGFAAVTIPATALVAGYLTGMESGTLKLMRLFLYVATFWAAACSVQFLINPEYLINRNGRFYGMLSNPQLAGLYIAPTLTIALWAMLTDPDRRHKLLAFGVLGMFCLFAAWTGSRTTVAMTLIGWTFVLWSRLGKLVLFLPVVAVLVYALSFLSDELQIGANLERLGSTENTRASAWQMQLTAIAENPWIGIGWEDTGATENSYLAGFAGYGILMFLLLLLFMLYGMYVSVRLLLARGRLSPHDRSLADLAVGFHMMYFIGAGAEGFMLGRSSSIQTTLLIMGAIAVYVLHRAEETDYGVVESEQDSYGATETPEQQAAHLREYA